MISRRLFIGVPISQGLTNELFDTLKKLRTNADKKRIDVKWTPKDNFHITMNFLGDTDSETENQIGPVVESVCGQFAPFKVKVLGLGAFPDLHHPRVLWAGAQKKSVFVELFRALQEALEPLGIAPDAREFTPHITIGRIRKSKSINDMVSPFIRRKFGEVEVHSVTLFESVLQSHYPVYKPLASWPLVGLPE